MLQGIDPRTVVRAGDFCADDGDDGLRPCARDRRPHCPSRAPEDAVRMVNFVQAATDTHRANAIRSFYDASFTIRLQGDRSVTIPFRINGDDSPAKIRLLEQKLKGSPAARCASHVVCGRPTPAELELVVAELARRDPAAFAPERTRDEIRAYLSELGIGIDCAGSVAQALYACRGCSRRQLGLGGLYDAIFAGIDYNRAFEKVADPSAVRPGDVIVLDPPPDDCFGHKVIVVDKRVAGPVVFISVMSSWGHEGPAERTWVYDPATGSWGDLGGVFTDGTPFVSPASGPWDHPMRGIYRAR